jgi:RimJ/RimL family protein N-acetyltransferase
MTHPSVHVTEFQESDLPFLFKLWQTADVMRYADEFPKLRGWTKKDNVATAWQRYREKQAELGAGYIQLILRLADGELIGESFFTPLPQEYTFGKWQKPEGVLCLMGDIKLLPAFWGRGLGTAGMRLIVEWLFSSTPASLLIVPPHRKNPAAERVYENAGFKRFTGMKSWYGHKVMELSREAYNQCVNPV